MEQSSDSTHCLCAVCHGIRRLISPPLSRGGDQSRRPSGAFLRPDYDREGTMRYYSLDRIRSRQVYNLIYIIIKLVFSKLAVEQRQKDLIHIIFEAVHKV